MAIAKPGSAEVVPSLDDFELVRNSEGQWLLVLPDIPQVLADDPLADVTLQLLEDDLFLECAGESVGLSSLIARPYTEALRADKPETFLLCVVDDEGNRRLVRKIAFSF
ncbi:MAG: hypothetical protein HY053_06260 [Proteobacteria bacterium]|nr:hypothetical protein [Pseudomonadota bacterium]